MRLRRLFSVVGVCFMAAASLSAAADGSTPEEAKELLNKAVAYLEEEGPAKAFCAFNNPGGPFHKGELYVFVVNLDGVLFANSATPSLVGTSFRDTRDAAGQPIGQNLMEIARSQGEGSLDYLWLNHVSNKVEKKRSFIKRVEGFVLGAGYYTR